MLIPELTKAKSSFARGTCGPLRYYATPTGACPILLQLVVNWGAYISPPQSDDLLSISSFASCQSREGYPMGVVIEVNFRMQWRKAVYVGDGDWLTQEVASPAEAIAFMKNSFRFQSGESYSRAWQGCHDAIAGKLDAVTSRKLFVVAYVEDSVRSSWESQELRLMEGEF
jgi:hypothetical protein